MAELGTTLLPIAGCQEKVNLHLLVEEEKAFIPFLCFHILSLLWCLNGKAVSWQLEADRVQRSGIIRNSFPVYHTIIVRCCYWLQERLLPDSLVQAKFYQGKQIFSLEMEWLP